MKQYSFLNESKSLKRILKRNPELAQQIADGKKLFFPKTNSGDLGPKNLAIINRMRALINGKNHGRNDVIANPNIGTYLKQAYRDHMYDVHLPNMYGLDAVINGKIPLTNYKIKIR